MNAGVGLVLSGGASRGAYEAGVLRFLLLDLPKRLGKPTWPDVVSGTSIGAMNGAVAAARDEDALRRAIRTWQTMRIGDVYRFRPLRAARGLLGRIPEAAILDPRPMWSTVRAQFPHDALAKAIQTGALRAFVVAATEVATGRIVLFTMGDAPLIEQPGFVVRRETIGPAHCAASGAIPVLFPAVRIGSRWYVDGGVRQNTPLQPILGTGVRHAIVVAPKLTRDAEADRERPDGALPSPLFLAGKMLNALLVDPIDRDVWETERDNRVLRWGAQRFGPTFAAEAARDLGVFDVDLTVLRPSYDLAVLAREVYKKHPPVADRATRWLLDQVADRTSMEEADLLSYLLADKAYTGAAEQLGWEDAALRESELAKAYA